MATQGKLSRSLQILALSLIWLLLPLHSVSFAAPIEYIVTGDGGVDPRLPFPSGPGGFVFVYNGPSLLATFFTVGELTLTWRTADGPGGIGPGLGFLGPHTAVIVTVGGEDPTGLTTATTMYGEMGMRSWLEKAEAEIKESA